MTTSFKVWLEIEEYDMETGDGRESEAPGSFLAEFDSHGAAYEFAEAI